MAAVVSPLPRLGSTRREAREEPDEWGLTLACLDLCVTGETFGSTQKTPATCKRYFNSVKGCWGTNRSCLGDDWRQRAVACDKLSPGAVKEGPNM
ncbi:hypothetical protein NDU88_000164 [Pleurodeles waltl]|uniref:Uncharacterized protein n=1 Tax=Pleurodeles waltl TaxID=8319 RepID=A0AAV7WEM6_PLEWA|nr:hypothetical protein NDU88_000164 [Pleurodeles waltl]